MTDNGSNYYQGDQGKDYFSYQNEGGLQRGRINARKFNKYVEPNDVVLDFGCGNGSLLFHLNCQQKIGVEINPYASKVAEENGITVFSDVKQITDGSINMVISNHALEHVLCPLDVLKELRKKLVSDGRIILCLPIDDWRTQKSVEINEINHQLYTWTPLLIGNLLLEAGFSIISANVYTHAWPPKNWKKLDDTLPVWLFDIVCKITAVRFKRRQIIALAKNNSSA